MESFFHTLKTELVMHCDYKTRDQARASLFDYMEVFYNRQRRHSTLNYEAPLAFEAMQSLGKNGVLVLASVTGGDRKIEVPADRINLDFVLGNKVMVGTVNAGREYFEMGVRDMSHAEASYPGWLEELLTHPVKGLENWAELFEKLTSAKGAIKVFCEVASL